MQRQTCFTQVLQDVCHESFLETFHIFFICPYVIYISVMCHMQAPTLRLIALDVLGLEINMYLLADP